MRYFIKVIIKTWTRTTLSHIFHFSKPINFSQLYFILHKCYFLFLQTFAHVPCSLKCRIPFKVHNFIFFKNYKRLILCFYFYNLVVMNEILFSWKWILLYTPMRKYLQFSTKLFGRRENCSAKYLKEQILRLQTLMETGIIWGLKHLISKQMSL